ncbi:hypothetical protein JOM56_015452 [Amanita muscaria]
MCDVALSNSETTAFCLSFDASQQEGSNAEAPRLTAAPNLNVKLLIDDNDVTFAGHLPSTSRDTTSLRRLKAMESRSQMVNGVALDNHKKTVFCLGSDGSQQEGDGAEAARLAAAQNLNVKLLIDDDVIDSASSYSKL